MIGIIKAFFNKKYPKDLKDEWIACNVLGDSYFKTLHPGARRWKYHTDKDGYIDYKLGQLIPLIENGKEVAYYKIIGWRVEGFDRAGWDDGRKYHLKLHSIV